MKLTFLAVLLFCGVNITIGQFVGYNVASTPPFCFPSSISFTNTSSGCDSYLWDFGDGTTSTAVNPTHTFTSGGEFVVKLTGYSGGSLIDQTWNYLWIEGPNTSLQFPDVCPGEEIYFPHNVLGHNMSNWDMGDGTTFPADPYDGVYYEYSNPGTYTISVDVTTYNCGTYTVSNPINVFAGAANTYAQAGLDVDTVCPNDLVGMWKNQEDFYVDWGDGYSAGPTNEWEEAYHRYVLPGTYYVSMTLFNDCGNDSTFYDTVVVSTGITNPPYTQLNLGYDTICINAENYFYTYTGASSIHYDFGDGNTAVQNDANQDTYHAYSATGNYQVIATTTNGCGLTSRDTAYVHVRDDIGFSYVSINVTDTVCFGGGILVDASLPGNSENDYDLIWDFGDGSTSTYNTTTHNYVNPGNYNVTFTATNKCGIDTTLIDVVVVSNSYGFSNPFVGGFPQQACPGDTALILFVPAGTNTYQVDYGSGFVSETAEFFNPGFQWSYDIIKHQFNAPIIHNVTLRVTNQCGISQDFPLSFDYTGSMTAEDLEISYFFDETVPVCLGEPLVFQAAGADNFMWDFGDGSSLVASQGMIEEVTHVYNNPGTYSVTVTGLNSCGLSNSFTEDVIIPDTRINVTANSLDATCGNSDGTGLVSVTGGKAPYKFSWTSGDSTIIADSLAAGLYQVNVTDSRGCKSFDIATVSDQEAPTIIVSNLIDVSCFGGSDGAVDVNVIGGNPPFSFLWSNGKTTEDINNLSAGPYELIVTDGNGCMSTESVFVGSPDEAYVSFVKKNSNCGQSNGFATATVAGSSGPYTFVWDNGQGGSTISGLDAGIYGVSVIDGSGCLYTDEIVINDIGAPTIIIDSISALDCGGSGSNIYIDLLNGTPSFNFIWNTGATTPNLLGVNAGDYSLEVTDGSGCRSFVTASIAIDAPLENPICLVTVDTTTYTNKLVWEKVQTGNISHYNIYRESSVAGLYFNVASVNADSLSWYTDPVADPSIQSWRYKITAVDDCGTESDYSDHHKTIHLTSNLGVGGVVNLIWDQYEGFNYSTYNVWRYSDLNGWELLTSLPTSSTSYTDPAPPVGATNLGYQIEVAPGSTCTAAKANDLNSSRSNRSQVVGGLPNSTDIAVIEGYEIVSLYPNPASNEINVGVNLQNGSITIQLIDEVGRVVISENVNGNGLTLTSLDISNIANGIYTVLISNEEAQSFKKVVVQK